jgi:Na+/H+ antiporter NhaD/arsenite permease-like protein
VFLDTVTTVVLMAPVTMLICGIPGLNPIALMVAALLSDTGGVATLVGDPPNVLIVSAADFSFHDFLIYALLGVAVAWVGVLILLHFLFRDELSRSNAQAVMSLNAAESLDDGKTTCSILIVPAAAILLFFVHHILHINPSFIAWTAMAVALL